MSTPAFHKSVACSCPSAAAARASASSVRRCSSSNLLSRLNSSTRSRCWALISSFKPEISFRRIDSRDSCGTCDSVVAKFSGLMQESGWSEVFECSPNLPPRRTHVAASSISSRNLSTALLSATSLLSKRGSDSAFAPTLRLDFLRFSVLDRGAAAAIDVGELALWRRGVAATTSPTLFASREARALLLGVASPAWAIGTRVSGNCAARVDARLKSVGDGNSNRGRSPLRRDGARRDRVGNELTAAGVSSRGKCNTLRR